MTTTIAPSRRITDEVTSWPGVEAGTGDRGEFGFRVGRREIGHLHGDRVLHIGFPKSVWQELFDAGRIGYHPVFPGKPGYGSRELATDDDVEDAIALLAEQLFDSAVPEERFAKERRVVIDEIRGRHEDPVNLLHEQAWRRFYGEPFGHPIAGSVQSLRRMTPVVVRRFLRRHFVPSRMTLCASGGVSQARLRRAVTRAFPRRRFAPSARGGRPRRPRTGFVRLRRSDLTQAYLVRMVASPRDHRRQLALSLAIDVVGADPDARLFQEVRERLGLGYDVGASLETGPDWAATVLSASAAREHERRLVDTVERTCVTAAGGFAVDEVARARRKLGYRLARLQDSRLDRALAHATRVATGRPSIAESARLLARLDHAEVEDSWRDALRRPTLTAVLSA